MEGLDANHGLVIAISSLSVAICLNFGKWIFERFFEEKKQKERQSDQTRVDVIRLEFHMKRIEEKLDEALKLNKRADYAIAAVRALAGEKWMEIVKTITNEELK